MTIETIISIYAAAFLFAAIFGAIASFITHNAKLFASALYFIVEALAAICMRLALSTSSVILSFLSIFMMVTGIIMVVFYVVYDHRKKSKSKMEVKK